jgi:hypothetical protein
LKDYVGDLCALGSFSCALAESLRFIRERVQSLYVASERPHMIGVAIGLAAAFGLARLMSSLLFGVSASDPATFAAVAILLFAIALAACYIPARRAMRVGASRSSLQNLLSSIEREKEIRALTAKTSGAGDNSVRRQVRDLRKFVTESLRDVDHP